MTAAAPWLFSERDVLDLMRLKKPLLLDSRFFSVASCGLDAEPLTDGSLKKTRSTCCYEPIKSQFSLLLIRHTTPRPHVHTLGGKRSLEAEFDDFLGEEVVQALVQLSHDAVLLPVLWRRAAGGLPLKGNGGEMRVGSWTRTRTRLTSVRNLHVVDWASSWAWVSVVVWCGAPAACAPSAAARPEGGA